MSNNCLLIRKKNTSLKEARGMAHYYKRMDGLNMKCRIIWIDQKHPSQYYCFGKIPTQQQRDDIDTNGFFNDVFFFENI